MPTRGAKPAIRAEAQLLAAQSGLAPDTAVLAHADEIERLSTQSGAWLKARADLPGVQREADGFTADLAALAIRLGLPDADAVLARQPSDADRARLEALLDEAAKRDAKLAAADTKLATERLDLASQQREREGRGPLRDPRPLRERLAALAGALKRIEAADELAVEAAAERRSLAEASARLRPASRTSTRWPASPCPRAKPSPPPASGSTASTPTSATARYPSPPCSAISQRSRAVWRSSTPAARFRRRSGSRQAAPPATKPGPACVPAFSAKRRASPPARCRRHPQPGIQHRAGRPSRRRGHRRCIPRRRSRPGGSQPRGKAGRTCGSGARARSGKGRLREGERWVAGALGECRHQAARAR